MRRLSAIYAAAAVCVALPFAHQTIGAGLALWERATGFSGAVWIVLWLATTFGPLALSVAILRKVGNQGARWLPHFLFIPSSVILYKVGASTFANETGVNAASAIGGSAMLVANALLSLTILVHLISLIAAVRKPSLHPTTVR